MLVLFLFRPAVYLNPDDGDMADGRREAGNKIVKNRVRIQTTFFGYSLLPYPSRAVPFTIH